MSARDDVVEQLALTQLWPCTTCDSTGRVVDRETGGTRVCPTCLGAASLDYDPADVSEVPY